MRTLTLEVITPETGFPPVEAVALDVPAYEGRLTVLPGHEPLICRLQPGRMRARVPDGRDVHWDVDAGTLRVHDNTVTVLVRGARQR